MCLSHLQVAVLKIPEDVRSLLVPEHAIVRITVAGKDVRYLNPLKNVYTALMQNGNGIYDGGLLNT